jgi:ABC-2 type transport system ATP-binding protein
MSVTISNLNKIFQGEIQALNSLSIDIKKGETFGLLGPNGAGKTTLLKILKGLIKPSSGHFSIENIITDFKTYNNKIKKFTGYLPENPPIFPSMTAHEYLTIVAILYEVPKAIINERIQNLLHYFNLIEWEHKTLNSFSEGMLQKIHWAATLIHNPPIILLDDPLRALDVHSFEMIVKLMNQMKKLDKTIIVSTHYLALVEKVCDKIAIISLGQLVTVGTIPDILKQSNSTNLVEAYLKLFPSELPSEDTEELIF